MSKNKSYESYSSKKAKNTRVKVKSRKKTAGITLPPNLLERARKHKLNISRITEQALLSILDYLEPQNTKTSSNFLGEASFKEGSWCGRRDSNPGSRLGKPGS